MMHPAVNFSISFAQINVQFFTDLLFRLAIVGLILLSTWIVWRILRSFTSKALRELNPNIVQQIQQIVTWLTWLTGILIALSQIGLDLMVLLVIIAIGGVVLTIAFKPILSNLVSYEVISSYKPFKIGDWIQVGKHFGRVIDITWLNTVLMTPANERLYIPNSKITQIIIVNKTTPIGTRISVSIEVSRSTDLAIIEKILLDIGTELKEELITDSKPEVRITKLNANIVRVALLLKINNPAKSAFIASEVRKKAKQRIDKSTVG